LPIGKDNLDGDIRLSLSNNALYRWSLSENKWINLINTDSFNVNTTNTEYVQSVSEISILSDDGEQKVISTVVKEKNLENSVRDALSKGLEAYDILQDKIGYDDLKPSVKSILDAVSDTSFKTYWKDHVSSELLLPSVETGLNSNGDIRMVLENNSLHRWVASENRWVNLNATSGGPIAGDYNSPISIVRQRFILDEFFAYAGQQIFNLRSTYAINTNDLQVILNGILLSKDDDYLEIDNKTIQILFPLQFEDYLIFTVSGQETIPNIIVEKHMISESKNRVILNHAIGSNPSVVQLFLNGISLSFGELHDYVILNNKTVMFNYVLDVGDIVIARFEHSSLVDNFEMQFSQMQRVYMELSKQVQYLRESVEKGI
jgi:hypothetical protein